MMRWGVLKRCMVVCALVLPCSGVVEASFFSDWLIRALDSFVEERAVENAPDCALSADDAYARIIELLSDGRQGEAEDFARSAVKTHKNDVRILFAKAVLERSRWDKGAAQVWFAMARKANGSKALSRAAWLSMQLDRYEAVEENLAELIRISDENPNDVFLMWLGAIQCRQQSRTSSRLSKAQKKKVAQLGKERYEMLLKHFQLGPVMVHHTYANILTEDTGDYDKALEHRILAVSMEARSWSLEGFADTLTELEKYRWACVVWEQSIKKETDARCFNRWGDALFKLGEYEEAARKYREAISLEPRKGYHWDDLADCLEKLGKKEEMFTCYQQAVDLGHDRSKGNLGWCYYHGHGVEKDGAKAFKLYSQYKEECPESVWVHRNLGDCYADGVGVKKDPVMARQYYEQAVKMGPDDSAALNNLAWDLVASEDASLHDYPRAIELVKRSIELDENTHNIDTLAVAYEKNGQYGKAVETQQRLIAFWLKNHRGKEAPPRLVKRLERYKRLRDQGTGDAA